MSDGGLKEPARVAGGVLMFGAVAAGVGWVASLFVGETAAFIAALFVVGFALYAYGLDGAKA